jgi:hypothetical protein
MKLTNEQREHIQHAMDEIHAVMLEVEGNHKRIWNALDKVMGILYNVIFA